MVARFKSTGAYGSVVADNTGTSGGGTFSARQNGSTYAVFGVAGGIEGNSNTNAALFAETGSAINFYTNGSPTVKATIDTSGNFIAIGNKIIGINGTSVAAGTFAFRNSSGVQKSAIGSYYNIADEGNLEFINGTTTNMVLNSSGNLLVGSSSTIGTGGKFQVTSSTDTSIFKSTSGTTYAAIVSNVENTAARLMAFQYGSGGSPTNVGTITTNGTGVTYGTSSDYRLKENIAPMIGALDKVEQLKPVTYKWKANGSDGQGFIAHELKEVVPDAVQGEKDAVDEDGNPIYQGIDTSYLVATLTAAIQEQQVLITQLTARITALEEN
jgi:hypothetical protein